MPAHVLFMLDIHVFVRINYSVYVFGQLYSGFALPKTIKQKPHAIEHAKTFIYFRKWSNPWNVRVEMMAFATAK